MSSNGPPRRKNGPNLAAELSGKVFDRNGLPVAKRKAVPKKRKS